MHTATLISVSQPRIHDLSPEAFITYIARVSNPSNQLADGTNLIKYLIRKKHWSPFEHTFLTFEVITSRAISPQILRHRSLTFQELSQRYSSDLEIELPELRKQAKINRQGTDTKPFNPKGISKKVAKHLAKSKKLYDELIKLKVGKECARAVLPLATKTTLYVSGTLRSFIHYAELRSEPETQKEHRLIALAILEAIKIEFPTVYEALQQSK